MTDQLDTLIALSEEYIRVLKERKKILSMVLILYQKLDSNVQD